MQAVGAAGRDLPMRLESGSGGAYDRETATGRLEQRWREGRGGSFRERTVEGVRFCRAPAGRIRMGSPETEAGRRADEGPVEVTLRRGFWMGKFEVTQGQWAAVCGAFPRARDEGVGDDSPVHWVRYVEAEEVCRRLTERAVGTLSRGWAIRLPTEAQWESACRAGTRTGTTTATAFGERLSGRDANFGRLPYGGGEAAPALGRASQAVSYPANAWGLCDMHGNEWAWCRDWYHARLPGGTDPDLSGTKEAANRDGTYSRVRRGGAWIEAGWACRPAMRLRYEPERRSDHIGFRVAAVG